MVPMGRKPGEGLVDAERFDPPVTRVELRTQQTESFQCLVERLRALRGAEGVDRMLAHRGLQLDGRPVGWSDAPGWLAAGTRVVGWVLAREPEPIGIGPEHVLYDADGIVAAAKPAWLPVQGTRASQRFSFETALRVLLGCPGLRAVNRLDRETSGVVLLAREAGAAGLLGRALAARQIRRRYLAVVAGIAAEAFEVEGLLVRVPGGPRFRFALTDGEGDRGGRTSRTRFAVLRSVEGRTLLAAEPVTGRTHQIRVHLAARGLPILGDRVYGNGPTSGARRCLLHAAETRFSPRSGGPEIVVRAPTPHDFGVAGFPAAG